MITPGTRFGVYEVTSPIGSGGMGEVYRARDTRLRRDVALKTLPPAFAADRERVARFEREARILASLNHPNIATIHGLEEQDGVLALVMELVEGETLQDLLRREATATRGVPLPIAVGIARQVADALDAAHEKGIVHRDLKPANVKLTGGDQVKVLDFGLAKAIATGDSTEDLAATRSLAPDETRHGSIMGTLAYMSPEQARGQAVDKRTDIWAFGCLLYELLTGRPAFARETASDTIAAVLGAEADWSVLPADVPPAVRRLLTRCLEKNAKARLRDIGDARVELDAEGAPAPASPEASAVTPAKAMSRRKWLTGGAAIGLLGAGFGGGALLAGRRVRAAMPSYQRLTFRRGMIRTARFGPDFQTVLYGALWDGDVCRVYGVRPDSPESAALLPVPATPLAASASGELALSLGTHLRGTMTYGTLAKVPLAGGAPRELQEDVKYADWSPDGRELAVIRQVGGREQLEYPLGTVIAKPTDANAGFSFCRVSPRGDAVAAFELVGTFLNVRRVNDLVGRVVIVDRSGVRRTTSPVFLNVFGLAWSGDEVWFTAADELPLFRDALHAMTASGEVRVVARVPGNISLHDIAPDGRVLMARTDDRSGISVFAPGDTAERDLSWLDAPVLADISPDGRRILFSETGVGGGPRGSSYLRGTDGSSAKRLSDGWAQALSPDGHWAIVRTESPHFDLVPTGAGQTRRLARAGLILLNARWLSDNRRVAVRAQAGEGHPRLYVLGVEDDATQPVTPDALAVNSTWSLSPNDSMVAVSTDRGPEIVPIAGGPMRPVPGASGQWRVVGWIDRGLLVSENPSAGGAIFLVDPATGRRELWKDIQPRDPTGIMHLNLEGLVVTPDGRAYGYRWHRATSDLYLVKGWS